MSDKEEKPKNEEEGALERTPFMMTIPAGESFAIDFAKHEEDACLLMHAARLDDKNEAKLFIRYEFYKQNPNELTEQELKSNTNWESKEDVYVFNKGQKEITLEYTFYEDLNPVCEAQGSEIRIDGIFAQEVEEEDYYEEDEGEGEEEQGKEAEN